MDGAAGGLGTGCECQDEKENTLLNTEHFVVDADGGHGAGSSALPGTARQEKVEDNLGTEDRNSSVKKVEEDWGCSTQQATGPSSQGSVVLDGQHDFASAREQPSDFHGDSKVGLAQEPPGHLGSQKHSESYCPAGTEEEAKEEKAKKASSGVAGAPCRQEISLALHQSSGAPASAAAQNSYKGSAVLDYRGSRNVTKGKKFLPVKKKPRTFYSAEQLEELERMFQEDHYPDNEKRREIAAVVGVTPQRVLVWFQNRRAKWRKLQKLGIKGNRKYPASSALSVPFGSEGYGAPPLPALPLPDAAGDLPAVLGGDPGAGNSCSLLSTHPASPTSASASSGIMAPCEAQAQSKALPQLHFNSSGVECFPSFPSPPPIRRASLPLSLAFNPQSHIVPLMLDTPSSECSLASQENGSREASYCGQNQGFSLPMSCPYPEQLEPADNLEATYCQYSSQGGIYQLSQFCHQGHLANNMFSSDHLPPPTPLESHPAFPGLPCNSGAIIYGATQGYVQNHMGGPLMPQQPSGNSGDVPAYPAVPWNDFYMQGTPFSNQLHSQMPFSSMAGGQYFTEPYLLQVPNGTALESMPQPGKQKGVTPPEQSSYQSYQTEPKLAALTEKEAVENSSKKGGTVVETKEESND